MPPRVFIRRLAGHAAAVLFSLAVAVVLAELGTRQAMPWLAPGNAGYSRETGLPVGSFERRAAELRATPPDVLVVGDSFVATGELPGGWLWRLRQGGRWKIGSVGVPAATPSQYLLQLDALRSMGLDMPALVLLYLGNDLVEEGLWTGLGPDRSAYAEARMASFSDAARPTFWPCVDAGARGRLEAARRLAERSSALYRALTLARAGVSGPGSYRELRAFMERRCDQPPFSERVGGRLFFFRLHEAVTGGDPLARRGREALLRLLASRRGEAGLALAVVRDREESCRGFHGRAVASTAPLIGQIRDLGFPVLDPDPAFVEGCQSSDDVYLGDGHWGAAGQQLFAAQVEPFLRLASRPRP